MQGVVTQVGEPLVAVGAREGAAGGDVTRGVRLQVGEEGGGVSEDGWGEVVADADAGGRGGASALGVGGGEQGGEGRGQ